MIIVVPVLIKRLHCSENLKNGPLTNHKSTNEKANTPAYIEPEKFVTFAEALLNTLFSFSFFSVVVDVSSFSP